MAGWINNFILFEEGENISEKGDECEEGPISAP
jgi:hypothetical protein